MAGTYFIGFTEGTPDEEAFAAAIEAVRAGGDLDAITAGPTIIPAPDPDPEVPGDAPHPQVRIVTGIPDPRTLADAQAAAIDEQAALTAAADQAVIAKLSSLTPKHLDALDKLADLLKAAE